MVKTKLALVYLALSVALGLALTSGTLLVGAHSANHTVDDLDRPLQGAYALEWADQTGGSFWAVYVEGIYAYVAQGQSFLVFNVSNPFAPHLIGRLDGLTGATKKIVVQEDYAYLLGDDGYTGTQGLRVLDVSNPTAPKEITFLSLEGASVTDMVVHYPFLYLTVAKYGGIFVIDIQQPAHPVLLREVYGVGLPTAITITSPVTGPYAGKDLLLVNGNRETLMIFDASDPLKLTKIGEGSGTGTETTHDGDIEIVGSMAYVLGPRSLQLVDFTDPTQPVVLGREYFGYRAVQEIVAISGNYAYLSGYEHLKILDMTDPQQMQVVGGFDIPCYAGQSDATALLAQKILLIPCENRPLSGFYLDNPLQPEKFWEWDEVRFVNSITSQGEYAFGGEANLYVFDVSNPANIQVLNTAPIYGGPTFVEDNILYLRQDPNYGSPGYAPGGLQLVDVSQPTRPVVLDRYEHNVDFVTRLAPYIYLADDRNFVILNGTDVEDLQETAVYTPTYGIVGMTVGESPEGDKRYAYLTKHSHLEVLDVTNPLSITSVGLYTTTPPAAAQTFRFPVALMPGADGKMYAILAGSPVLDVVDVTDPEQMHSVFQMTLLEGAWNIKVQGKDLFIGTSDSGVLNYRFLEDPVSLVLVGQNNLPVHALDVESVEGFILVAAGRSGVFSFWKGWEVGIPVPVNTGPAMLEFPWGSLVFPSRTFTTTVTITATGRFEGNMPRVAELQGVERFFQVRATGDSQTYQPVQPYSLSVTYDEADLGGLDETELALYYWNGSQWVAEPTNVVNSETNQVTATSSRLGLWGVMGPREVSPIYLPFVQR